jgi:hypothetical protein
MGSLRGEEGKTASHFARESSNIRCGKSETCAYIRNGRTTEKMRTEAALSEVTAHKKTQ